MSNKNKYTRKRLKILLKGLIPSFIGFFLPKKNNRFIFNSTLNTYFHFNSKYLFEYFIKEYPEYEVKFVINDSKKRQELNTIYGIDNNYFIETETFAGIFYALSAKSWIASSFETPVGGVFLRYRRFIYHLGHGTHFKAIVFNESNLSLLKKIYYYIIRYNFSKYLTTSNALVPIYQEAFKCTRNRLIVIGEPRNDLLFTPNKSFFQKKFGDDTLDENNIIYAPTWRPDGSLRLFPFEDMDWDNFSHSLEEKKINIFLRMHPSYPEDLTVYTQKSSRIKILDNTIIEDITEILGIFDLLITDYSSIYINYLLLEKPVLFLPYDYKKFNDEMGFIRPYDELTPGPKPETMNAFIYEINKLLENEKYFSNERKKVSCFFNDYKNGMLKQNAQFILNEISGKK